MLYLSLLPQAATQQRKVRFPQAAAGVCDGLAQTVVSVTRKQQQLRWLFGGATPQPPCEVRVGPDYGRLRQWPRAEAPAVLWLGFAQGERCSPYDGGFAAVYQLLLVAGRVR